MRALWNHIQTSANNKKSNGKTFVHLRSDVAYSGAMTGTIEVKSLVQFVLDSKSLVSSTDAASILNVLFNVGSVKTTDYTLAATIINFDDFVELLCRLIASDLWIFGKAPIAPVTEGEAAPTPVPDPLDENANPSNTGEVVEIEPIKDEIVPPNLTEVLSQRLTHFVGNFDVTSLVPGSN